MNKKITGVEQEYDLEGVRNRMREANQNFQAYSQGFVDKKQEYKEMKQENDLEREQLRKEEKMAKSFKFTKMSKKVPFLPALNTRGFIQKDPLTSIDNQVNYRDYRDIEKLIFPDKVFEKEKKFKLSGTFGNYI